MQPNKKHKQKTLIKIGPPSFTIVLKLLEVLTNLPIHSTMLPTVHDYSAFRRHVRCHVKARNFRRSMTS